MNTIREDLSVVMTICGCVVGAGFVGGTELIMILGGSNTIANGVLFGVIYGSIIYGIMHYCDKYSINTTEQWSLSIGGRLSYAITMLLLLCYLCMTVTMLAMISQTMNTVLNVSTNLPIYGAVVAVAVSVFLFNGATGLKLLCSITLPIIMVVIIICVIDNSHNLTITGGTANITQCANYAIFNGVMSIGVLIPLSTCKHKARVSIATGCILAILITLILAVMDNQYNNSSIPLLSIATNNSYMVLYTICILLSATVSIATNSYILTSWLHSITGDRLFSVAIVMLISLLLSLFGLDIILGIMYPLITTIGVVMLLLLVLNNKRHAI